jgi:3-oxoacyl-[acyl-carrier protein] reductase
MDLQLSGKRALVTGSSSGIGSGIARTLAEEGVQVVIHGRDYGRAELVLAEIRAAGGVGVSVIGDLTSDASAGEVADRAVEALGGIDILINNAGGRRSSAPTGWDDLSISDWVDGYNTNVLSAVRLIKNLAPGMVDQGWGRIINISSFGAQSTSGQIAEYSAAKAALSNVTVGAAKVLTKTGVTVNTVSPGMIRTPALEGLLSAIAVREGLPPESDAGEKWMLANATDQTVDRLGTPEDVAVAVAWLSSPRSGFVNGANIRVDGGASKSSN